MVKSCAVIDEKDLSPESKRLFRGYDYFKPRSENSAARNPETATEIEAMYTTDGQEKVRESLRETRMKGILAIWYDLVISGAAMKIVEQQTQNPKQNLEQHPLSEGVMGDVTRVMG